MCLSKTSFCTRDRIQRKWHEKFFLKKNRKSKEYTLYIHIKKRQVMCTRDFIVWVHFDVDAAGNKGNICTTFTSPPASLFVSWHFVCWKASFSLKEEWNLLLRLLSRVDSERRTKLRVRDQEHTLDSRYIFKRASVTRERKAFPSSEHLDPSSSSSCGWREFKFGDDSFKGWLVFQWSLQEIHGTVVGISLCHTWRWCWECFLDFKSHRLRRFPPNDNKSIS